MRDGVTYVNVDYETTVTNADLKLDPCGELCVLPDVDKNAHPRAFDTETKLLQYILKDKPGSIESTSIFTLLPPCNSCAVVIAMYESTKSLGDVSVRWA